MIYFIYGEDSYRSKRKLEEIVAGYKKVHKSGLNLIYINAEQTDFKDFDSSLRTNSMFDEKKLIVLKNSFGNAKFCEDLLENIKELNETKNIVVIYESEMPDQRTKFFKALQKFVKCQEFKFLQPALLKKWVINEFDSNEAKISLDALNLLINFVGNDLWQMSAEIKKLSCYKQGSGLIKKEDVQLLVKPNIESDIFKTIDALASKDKKKALALVREHLENGDHPLYLLSMITYQFRNLLIIKELQELKTSYALIVKKSGLHPFVVQKTSYLCNRFSMPQLKKIYQKIFQVDSSIKTGKVEPETALNLLIAEI